MTTPEQMLDVVLQAAAVRPVGGEWELMLWSGGVILLGPGAHPQAPGPATPAE